jgi:hypoxanthine phosphoribosyltransferase
MNSELEKILFTKEQIQDRVTELGKIISETYKDCPSFGNQSLVLIGILKGSYMFLSDLSRSITIPHTIDFMTVSSYHDTTSTGILKIEADLRHSIEGKCIIIVEDIVDSGLTLNYLINLLSNRNPSSIECCTLLSKPTVRKIQVDIQYIGYEIAPEFVVGYGLDYNELFRNLGQIGVPTQNAIVKYANCK